MSTYTHTHTSVQIPKTYSGENRNDLWARKNEALPILLILWSHSFPSISFYCKTFSIRHACCVGIRCRVQKKKRRERARKKKKKLRFSFRQFWRKSKLFEMENIVNFFNYLRETLSVYKKYILFFLLHRSVKVIAAKTHKHKKKITGNCGIKRGRNKVTSQNK